MKEPMTGTRSHGGTYSTTNAIQAMKAAPRQSPGSLVANLKIGASTTKVIRKTITATMARRTVMRATGPAVSGRMRSSSSRIQPRTGSMKRVRRRTATSGSFRRPFAEQALRPEHEDQDQDREHDRLRPVAPGGMPGEALVVRLNEADADRAENRARQVPDSAEHRRREGDEPELEALVVPDIRDVQGVDDPRRAGKRTGDQERERDRPVDVDPHHGRSIAVLCGRAH